jgi:hypothetical protein
MRLYADVAGVVLAAQSNVEPGAPDILWGPPFEGVVASSLDFDTESNAALVADMGASLAPYRLLAGVLTKDGITVTPNGPGRTLRDKQFAAEKLAELEADGVLSDAHQDRVLRFVLRWIVRQG